MVRWRQIMRAVVFLAAAFLGGMAGSWLLQPGTPEAGPVLFKHAGDKPGIVATYGVGGVVTWEGEFWQYRPDKEKWVSLDESFALEGQATKVVPLPVDIKDVRHMETFGFLVAKNDECWLYDIDEQRWEQVVAPPIHARRGPE